jgi:hypothetical protein
MKGLFVFKRYGAVSVAATALVLTMMPCNASAWDWPCFWPPCDSREQDTESNEPVAKECEVGIWSRQETNIRDRVVTNGGKVGSDTRVEVGVDAVVNGDALSIGDIFLRDKSTVNGNAIAGGSITKQNMVVVTGDTIYNGTVPAYDIASRSFSHGTENITVDQGMTEMLAPGDYGEVHVIDGGTLVFSAGTYNLQKLIADYGNINLKFDISGGKIAINTNEELQFGDLNTLSLIGGDDPTRVQFYSNSEGQVRIGTDSTFVGIVTAPFAEIWVSSSTTFSGAIFGRRVWIDTDTTVNLSDLCIHEATEDTDDTDTSLDTDDTDDTEDTAINEDTTADFDDDFERGNVPDEPTESGDPYDPGPTCDPAEQLVSWSGGDESFVILNCADDPVDCETWDGGFVVEPATGGDLCEIAYCTEAGDEVGFEIEATTPGCAGVPGLVPDDEPCPMITLELGTPPVESDCHGLPKIPAVTDPQPDPDCLAKGGSVEACTLAAEECVTTTYCSDDEGNDRPTYERDDPSIENWDEGLIKDTITSHGDRPALPAEAYIHASPCLVRDWVPYSSGGQDENSEHFPTFRIGFDRANDGELSPKMDEEFAPVIGDSGTWGWNKGSRKWGASFDVGIDTQVSYLKGYWAEGAEVGAAYQARARAGVTVLEKDIEVASFDIFNKVGMCDWATGFDMEVFGNNMDFSDSFTVDNNSNNFVTYETHAGAPDNLVATCKARLTDLFNATRELLERLGKADLFQDAWETYKQTGELALEPMLEEAEVSGYRDRYITAYNDVFLPAMAAFQTARQAAMAHDFSAKVLDLRYQARSKDILDRVEIGPFDVHISAGTSGTLDAEVHYKNKLAFDETTSSGYMLPTFTEAMSSNPKVDLGGYAYAGAGIDLGIVGGSVGIDASLDIIHLQFPINGHYTINPVPHDAHNPNGDVINEAGTVDWNVDWHSDAKLMLTMMRGHIDLVLRGWVRFLWKKIKKTWRRTLVSWPGKEKMTKELFNFGETTTLLTTPNFFTLPELEITPAQQGPTQQQMRNILNPPVGRIYYTVDDTLRDIRMIRAGIGWWNNPNSMNETICTPAPQ